MADHLLATAAGNGAIVLWNLNKITKQKQGKDHISREVPGCSLNVWFYFLFIGVLSLLETSNGKRGLIQIWSLVFTFLIIIIIIIATTTTTTTIIIRIISIISIIICSWAAWINTKKQYSPNSLCPTKELPRPVVLFLLCISMTTLVYLSFFFLFFFAIKVLAYLYFLCISLENYCVLPLLRIVNHQETFHY